MILSVTKPKGRPARLLAEAGIEIVPIEEDEGNVDRYVISERLAIERRTGSGFLRGIMDKTLFTSAIYMREHFEVPVLIVEGEVDYEHSEFSSQAVRGALSSMMVVYGVNVLSTSNTEETVALIAMMTRQEQVGVPEISLTPKRKATDLADMQRRVIEMLPGCGITMARDLLQRFGSVKRIVNGTEDEFRAVQGIGAKKAAEIEKVLNAEYESVDTEKDLEDAIEAAPELLFGRPVTMLARQHYICTTADERHVVDLVFMDDDTEGVILVELKRGRLLSEHEAQLRRYLDHAHESELLRAFLDRGAPIRGLLATVTECTYKPRSDDISVCIADRQKTINVLKWLRRQRSDASGDRFP
jgi:ERCC4-type nuclease